MASHHIELLYFQKCPHVDAARAQLRRALAELGQKPEWTEVDVLCQGAPSHVKGYGSPTVLVDGKDVLGQAPGPSAGLTCRVYPGSDVVGAPPLEALKAALR